MKESINFSFDGIASEDMGVYIVNENGGLFEENFLPSRSIIETKVSNRLKPYFNRVESKPLEFTLNFFIEEWKDRDGIRQVARWLFQDYYKPLIFESNPDRIFYAMVQGDSTLLHNGRKEGYVRLNIRCNSPYSYSHPTIIEDIDSADLSTNVLNSGDLPVFPKFWITKTTSNGNISITHEDTGETLTIKNLVKGEEVYINNEDEELISDMEMLGVYHFDDHNEVFLQFLEGANHLILNGDFKLAIEYQTIYLAD